MKSHSLEPYFRKGLEGVITDIEEYSDFLKIKFDDGDYYKTSMKEFQEEFELIVMDKKMICPVVLKTWYKACEPYIGVKND